MAFRGGRRVVRYNRWRCTREVRSGREDIKRDGADWSALWLVIWVAFCGGRWVVRYNRRVAQREGKLGQTKKK